jgi:hypothetical protein
MSIYSHTKNAPWDSRGPLPPDSNDDNRCTFTSPSGYRCRGLRAHDHPFLCSRHAQTAARRESLDKQQALLDVDADVSADLLGTVENFRTAAAVNDTLGKLLLLLARNRISPRRGAVLAYTCQLLLQSLGGVKEEEDSLTSSFQQIDDVEPRVLDADSSIRPSVESAS